MSGAGRNPEVCAVISTAPTPARHGLDHLRARIHAVAAEQGVELTESLKWGQPSFVVDGASPLRIGVPKSGGFAIYAHCTTTLIKDYAAIVPDARIEGNRAVLFQSTDEARAQPLEHLIEAALRYHVRDKAASKKP